MGSNWRPLARSHASWPLDCVPPVLQVSESGQFLKAGSSFFLLSAESEDVFCGSDALEPVARSEDPVDWGPAPTEGPTVCALGVEDVSSAGDPPNTDTCTAQSGVVSNGWSVQSTMTEDVEGVPNAVDAEAFAEPREELETPNRVGLTVECNAVTEAPNEFVAAVESGAYWPMSRTGVEPSGVAQRAASPGVWDDVAEPRGAVEALDEMHAAESGPSTADDAPSIFRDGSEHEGVSGPADVLATLSGMADTPDIFSSGAEHGSAIEPPNVLDAAANLGETTVGIWEKHEVRHALGISWEHGASRDTVVSPLSNGTYRELSIKAPRAVDNGAASDSLSQSLHSPKVVSFKTERRVSSEVGYVSLRVRAPSINSHKLRGGPLPAPGPSNWF